MLYRFYSTYPIELDGRVRPFSISSLFTRLIMAPTPDNGDSMAGNDQRHERDTHFGSQSTACGLSSRPCRGDSVHFDDVARHSL